VLDNARANNLVLDNAQVNETIKHVAQLSRKLYLDSLNAMFSVRRSGDIARGFVIVTTQLRTLSIQVGEAMLRLQNDVELLLQEATALQRQRHHAALAHAALEQSDSDVGRAALASFRRRVDEHLREREQSYWQGRERVAARLRDALRIFKAGGNLAVLAKIEANQAGRLAQQLGQVAAEVEGTMVAMTDTLTVLTQELASMERYAA